MFEGQDATAINLLRTNLYLPGDPYQLRENFFSSTCYWHVSDLAYALARQGETELARKIITQSPEASTDPMDQSYALRSLGYAALVSQEGEKALEHYHQSIEVAWQSHYRLVALLALEGYAWALHMQASYSRAAQILGAAAEFRRVIGAPVFPGDQPKYELVLTDLKSRLGEEQFAASWSVGQATPFDQAVENILSFP